MPIHDLNQLANSFWTNRHVSGKMQLIDSFCSIVMSDSRRLMVMGVDCTRLQLI